MKRETIFSADEKIKKLFATYLNNKVFSGAGLAVSRYENKRFNNWASYYGTSSFDSGAEKVDERSYFDLASLTKPLVTVLSILCLIEKNAIDWQSELTTFLPELAGTGKESITVESLMNHSSGLVPHRKYYKKLLRVPPAKRKEKVIQAIGDEKLISEGFHCYSDLGYILLGEIVERISTMSLAAFAEKNIFMPLGLENELIYPFTSENDKRVYVSCGKCSWSNKTLTGHVHDDNCRSLGGVCGHAGLFGTLEGVVSLCREILLQIKGVKRHPRYSNELINRAVSRCGSSDWSCGFDMVASTGSSGGRYLSSNSFGHLGFTGTSFWIDPKKEVVIVLLTNRVLGGEETEGIKKFRPLVHDQVMEEIDKF